MSTRVRFHETGLKEFLKLDTATRKAFLELFDYLGAGFELSRLRFKKLVGTELFEFRHKRWRGIGGWSEGDFVMLLFFYKQTQTTPKQVLELARKRLHILRNENQD